MEMIYMKIEQVKNTPQEQKRTMQLNVRLTADQFEWIKKQQISATKIFQLALTELGYKPKQGEKKNELLV